MAAKVALGDLILLQIEGPDARRTDLWQLRQFILGEVHLLQKLENSLRLSEQVDLIDLVVRRIQLVQVLQLPQPVYCLQLVPGDVQESKVLVCLDGALCLSFARVLIHKLLDFGVLLRDCKLRERKRCAVCEQRNN